MTTDRIDDLHEAYQNMIGMKKIASSDVSHIVPRHTWSTGTVYVAWDSDDSAIYDKSFYIITSEFKVYKCISSPGTASTVEPTGESEQVSRKSLIHYRTLTISIYSLFNSLTMD